MAEAKILVNRPFEIRLDAKGEPVRFPCTILNGEVVPKEYVVQETLLDHWYMKDLIKRGRIELIGAGRDLPPAENIAIEDMTKAQLTEVIRKAQPEFDPGRMTKAQLLEHLRDAIVPSTTAADPESPPESRTEGTGTPEGSQENQE
jgi:hypothetical protein